MAYSKEQIIGALDKTGGMVYLAADALGCSYKTIFNWIKRSPDVAAVRDKWRGKLLDVAEIKLFELAKSGDRWAIGFALKFLAKDRGYCDTAPIQTSGEIDLSAYAALLEQADSK